MLPEGSLLKRCKNCSESFEVATEDLAFYDKVSPIFGGKKYLIPPPTFCPECRRQRKLGWRNERTLYKRNCSLCKKEIISVHAPDHPYPVYCNPCWWSDRWNPLSFGTRFDFSRPFLDQYIELLHRVPQRAMVNDDGVMSENCAYTFDVAFSKNCYMCFGMWKAQDCLYCRICDQSKFCVDCEGVKLGSELVYESVDSQRLYRCAFMQNSENCTDCFFGFDCKGCQDCLGCVGLRQKRFHIFNKPFSEIDYRNQVKKFQLTTRSGLQKFQTQFDEFSKNFPRKNMNLQNCEDCLGDHLMNCRKVIGYVSTNSDHSKWIERSDAPLWCYDQIQSGAPELCYEDITTDNGYMTHFSSYCNQSHHTYYSDNCLHCDDILGCVSLRRKKYCIFNTQYDQHEYEELVGQVLDQMQKENIYGEFLPLSHSLYAYNETNAAEFFPLTKEAILSRGWKWRTDLPYTTGRETITATALSDHIRNTSLSIINEILACSFCKKNYRIVKEELTFYQQLSLPIPDRCPDCRNRERLQRRNPQQLFDRTCTKCQRPIKTTYNPDRPEKIVCEECYLAQIY